MKKIYKNKILNIENTNLFDDKFLFDLMYNYKNHNIEIFHMSELLEKRKNTKILEMVKQKPAMYSNVYSPKDELEIFIDLFDYATKNNKKIHIIWITLDEEIKILEKYYKKKWYMRDDLNCYEVDFWKVLVSVSVKIENLMWKWSDYKAFKEKIFFNPPIRESWQVKSIFKWINRWVIASIYISNYDENIIEFLKNCIKNESILLITLAKVLYYNLEDIWFNWKTRELIT